MQFSKRNRRKRIHWRIRNKITGTPERPRLNIYRSNKYIYAQLIDDIQGHTLASASSREESVAKDANKSEQSKEVGKLLAERAKAANIDRAVFDRGGYLYHGRVKSLAEGAREGGLQL
ncbi:50S ribosomal protein L18 [Phaeodactylibacter sp.]|jgi:large subunit ribosomal protein L18|uniref:50S ribosomal protein L18 n=1 Tax=Phaeodactylibacter sp. TaxID=1940289 RepID=UPI0025F425E8|nr:50S ribosomal protein L18 [Phaeodactylibacter sp.]MCI4650548.1 50S ribosomal protein L18 [Phaeodactylibacter sp.]MCI5089345.1 50S ribosomal protein L18 [Phaeodactylibacter sp.]